MATKKYLTKSPVYHNGKTVPADTIINLTDEDAEHPLKHGAIKEVKEIAEAAVPDADGKLTPKQLAVRTVAKLIEYAQLQHGLTIKANTKKDDVLFEIAEAVKADKKATKEAE